MTNQLGARQLQYNQFLNASMQPSLGNTISMTPQNQTLLSGLQQYNALLVREFFTVKIYHVETSLGLNFSTSLHRVIRHRGVNEPNSSEYTPARLELD